MKKNGKKAFTLAEVLITMVVIGVVAALTVPTIVGNAKYKQYKTGVVKAQAAINSAVNKYRIEMGTSVECRYWESNPWGGGAKCTSRKENGDCAKYTMPDGSNLPSHYNGYFDDCDDFWEYLKTNGFNIAKKCDTNGFANVCMPEYKGNDTLYRSNNEANNPTDYDVNAATSGCSGVREANLRAKPAIVTADGMIWFPYSVTNTAIMYVDVNGERGPNKWGHDVHGFQAKGQDFTSNPVYYPNLACLSAEKGGVTTKNLIIKKQYNN